MSQLIILVIVTGVLAQVVSGIFRLPSIIFLLLFGVLLGPEGFKVIDPELLGGGLEVIVTLAVAVILFEGGMNLNLRHIREVQYSVRRLITWGFLFTFITATLSAQYIPELFGEEGLPLRLAMIFGALVTVTGPTVIRPLVRRIHVRREVATILEGEGILIDPLGAILAVFCLEFALGVDQPVGPYFVDFGIRLGVGAAVGIVVGAMTALIVRYQQGRGQGLKNLIVLACALGCYGAAESFQHEAGIMAVVVAGLVTQLGMKPHERELRHFKEQLTTLFLSILFILLAANLDIEAMKALGIYGLITVLTVMLVIRPINVFFSTWGGKPNFREKIFLSWTAPRGIVAASLASLAALKLASHDPPIPGGAQVEALVFMTVFMTVMVQGMTAGIFARMLGILAKEEGQVLIMGSNILARKLGKLFRSAGREVTLIDTNPYHCDQAERMGLTAICGSANDREVLRQAGILDVRTFIACTENDEVNELTAQVAHDEFEAKNIFVAVNSKERKELNPMLERMGVKLAFGRPIPMDAWTGELEDEVARTDTVVVTPKNRPGGNIRDLAFRNRVVPVAFRRDGQLKLCVPETRFEVGDTVHFLVREIRSSELTVTLGVLRKKKAPRR